MLKAAPINEIHQLYHGEHWSVRKIARHLHLARKTIRKYLLSPASVPARRPRTSKLDPFKPAIVDLLEQDPRASAVVVRQRLQPLGYQGGITILRAYVSQQRTTLHPHRAFVRMEPSPGERFEIDWGHFGALDYAGDKRKLYAFCLVEGHSRMLYLEFTHSQSFETFVRCHLHAFQTPGGVGRECWYDNLATVVAEHDGTLIRFNPRFLAFARQYDFCLCVASTNSSKRANRVLKNNGDWALKVLIRKVTSANCRFPQELRSRQRWPTGRFLDPNRRNDSSCHPDNRRAIVVLCVEDRIKVQIDVSQD
jgi:transposase